jgi:uncharacterized protein involved in exopolysaccharide biosynthesis/Mrp family chromosome partitioning ATPase
METRKHLPAHERSNPAGGFNLADAYYVIFRHKWKILVLSAAGLLAAAGVYFGTTPSYSSEAKLLIRYVVESRPPGGVAGDPQIKSPDPGGANIINTEIEIIKSLDLAEQVAREYGPAKILGTTGPETNVHQAAVVLQKGLTADVRPNSDILRIVFQHSDPAIVQELLTRLINAYLVKHVEIHRTNGTFDAVLQKQTLDIRDDLAETERQLRMAKTNAGVISIEDAKKAYAQEIAKIREELFNTQAELVERHAALEERQKLLPARADTRDEKTEPKIPSDKIEEYKKVCGRLESLRKKEQELLAQLTEEAPPVRNIREQISAAEETQRKLETAYPRLTSIPVASSGPGGTVVDLSLDVAHIKALQAKWAFLTNEWEVLTREAKAVNDWEPQIAQLQRQKELQEAKYRHFSLSLEQETFDSALSAGKMSNINIAQAPTLPYRESRQLVKAVSLLAIGGIVAGLALAFLIEFFLDPTVRRSTEIETRLRLPLFLNIPSVHRNGRPASLDTPGAEPGAETKLEVAPVAENGLISYWEALRDRLVTYFEIQNLTHKPKLIAVTSCGKGAGVTTVATGLAASLSETGDGNVLVVDMTAGQGAAHPFFRGKPAGGLAEALANGTRENALVQHNLYAVAETGKGGLLPRILPRRFNSLVPKIKASDYDYIIFDMPPVSQISITPRLASFMDMVLLVIESEKTDRNVVQRATAMLAESNATVRAILNKNRRYVPERLLPEA